MLLPADSFPITKVRGPDRWAGGAVKADRAAAKNPLRRSLDGIFEEVEYNLIKIGGYCVRRKKKEIDAS
jgi:hypothetical protein